MGDLVGLDGKRISSNGAQLGTPDIAAAWQQISTQVAIDHGIVTDVDTAPHFLELHPVIQAMMCEAFQQMIDLGFIVPGYESAFLELQALAQKVTDNDPTPAVP